MMQRIQYIARYRSKIAKLFLPTCVCEGDSVEISPTRKLESEIPPSVDCLLMNSAVARDGKSLTVSHSAELTRDKKTLSCNCSQQELHAPVKHAARCWPPSAFRFIANTSRSVDFGFSTTFVRS